MVRELLLKSLKSGHNIYDQIDDHLISKKYLHILSLNPENFIIASKNSDFLNLYHKNDSTVIADGIGIVWATNFLGMGEAVRQTGADLMNEIAKKYMSRKIVFLGGRKNAAEKIVENFKKKYGNGINFYALGDVDKKDMDLSAEVAKHEPDILFVAFGSPDQELWIDRNKETFKGTVCMGVGGGFDFAAGIVPRAPTFLRKYGFEWLYRLTLEPWRFFRQLRLLTFIKLILYTKVGIHKAM